jgi:LysR family cyn operon transcriptional activator
MELRHLRYFLSVAEAASVSRAARRMHITQPALSRQIRDLESELGVRLFDRTGRHIQLTAEGEDLLGRSREVLTHAELLGERARALSGGAAGILRLGATPQTMQSVVAPFLVGYRRAWPGVEVHLTEEGGIRLLNLVETGHLHLAVGGVLAGTPLSHRVLYPVRVLAVTTSAPRWKRRASIDVGALANEPLLLLRPDFGSRQVFDAACRIAHVHPRVILESAEPHSLITLAETGQGIAIVPSTVRFVSKRIHVMPIVQVGKSLGVWGAVVWDARRSQPSHATTFIEALTAYTRRTFPGQRFDRVAPPVPRPPEAV